MSPGDLTGRWKFTAVYLLAVGVATLLAALMERI